MDKIGNTCEPYHKNLRGDKRLGIDKIGNTCEPYRRRYGYGKYDGLSGLAWGFII